MSNRRMFGLRLSGKGKSWFFAALLVVFLLCISLVQAGDTNQDLVKAAKKGDSANVLKLLQQGALASYKDKDGRTAQWYAAEKKHFDTVKVLDDWSFDAAKKSGSSSMMESYLKDFPSGLHRVEAGPLHEKYSFDEAMKEKKVEALESFQKRFPGSGFSNAATERIRVLRFEKAQETNTVIAYETFLKLYPTGPDSEQLQRELPALRVWEPKRLLGELIVSLSPETDEHQTAKWASEINGMMATYEKDKSQVLKAFVDNQNAARSPEPTTSPVMRAIKELLEKGVDCNSVRITGFRPSTTESGRDSRGGIYFNTTAGTPGYPVPAESARKGDLTLWEYCDANKLGEVRSLLLIYCRIQ